MPRPPGILMVTAGYGAGLATGLARFPELVGVVVLLLLVTWLLRDEWWVITLPAIAGGIVVGQRNATEARRSCAARMPLGSSSYIIHAIDPGEGTGRASVVSLSCEGVITAAWPRGGGLPAGRTAHVVARWIPSAGVLGQPGGILMISTVGTSWGSPTPVERFRNTFARRARALYGPRAPLVDAMLAGWRSALDPELKAAFASAGLMHLLAISGFHLACLAGWIVLILCLAGVPRHPAEAAAAGAMVAYAAVLGWPPAATRAAALLAVLAFCRWRQRQVRISAVAAASALVVLIGDPWSITSAGGWMSILGLAGVIVAVRWSDRAISKHPLVRSLSASTGALVATAPLAAAAFGQVAPAGIVLSLVGIPLVAMALPLLVLSIALNGILAGAAQGLAASGNGVLVLLDALVRGGALLPGSASSGASGFAAALPWTGIAASLAWVIHGPTTLREAVRRMSWVVTVGSCVLLAGKTTGDAPGDGQTLALLFLDVGQGDAALIRTPRNHWIEVDAGPTGDGWDAGRRVIVPYLASHGVHRIDLFVLSHAHRDHVGGASAVLARVPTDVALEPGELFSDSAYDGWLGALAAHHVRWRAARAGTQWSIDGVEFHILHPPTPWARQGDDLNEDSIVLEVRYHAFDALLMGDAGFVAESAMAPALHRTDLLKVGHHGSKTATSDAFLEVVQPQAAVVSVGHNNYGHPSPDALARLDHAGAAVWRTDRQGLVTVTTDGRTFTVQGARSTATFTVRP